MPESAEPSSSVLAWRPKRERPEGDTSFDIANGVRVMSYCPVVNVLTMKFGVQPVPPSFQ